MRHISLFLLLASTQIAIAAPQFHVRVLAANEVECAANVDHVVYFEQSQSFLPPSCFRTDEAARIDNINSAAIAPGGWLPDDVVLTNNPQICDQAAHCQINISAGLRIVP